MIFLGNFLVVLVGFGWIWVILDGCRLLLVVVGGSEWLWMVVGGDYGWL